MTARPSDLGVSTTALPLLRELIHARAGLEYSAERSDVLLERVVPLVLDLGFNSILDYYYLLKYDRDADMAWLRLMDALAVPESYFWREIAQLRAIVDHIVPALVQRFTARPLRIWSIPCAGGEEPLTLAMMLNEASWFDRASIELHASDASPAAVARARRGFYRERAFRSLPGSLRERYFTPVTEGWQVAPELHARIASWSVENLMAVDRSSPLAGSSIILCRNVFIYFSRESIRQVVDRLADCMPSPGYLCVGASESLLTLTSRFELEEIGDAFIYVKDTPDRRHD